MRLATRRNGTPDGELVLVSSDGKRCLPGGPDWMNLLTAIASWDDALGAMRSIADRLNAGEGEALDQASLGAPMPRSWQWLDGSAFSTHGALMQIAFNLPPIDTERPLMYQGMSDRFYGPNDDIPFPDAAHGIDFEGEFGVIVDTVPMGTSAADALRYIRLVVQINDWSLRAIAPIEMKTGFGWVQAKPACSMAPFAVTPDELGDAWRDGRVCLNLEIDWNGRRIGAANGSAMDFGFHELIAHAALTRDLVAGTIIGSGTVSNPNYGEVGSSCISEIRAIEMIEKGAAETPFMAFGDTIRMEGVGSGRNAPFGVIEQTVVRS
ncbi:fumarylacetoacetate hydrolase family protein [Sphingobium sp. DEHP117]|uniref:fumarylacetoacetate hydrolase family protein n=1 Tax=Sphingobium sp. DEHP117 TaxID=2993436 RepID=UPI0027D66616|nr:fumarylacetoacetate hydrolase family protein [Sphingobium sp. DEHP117]MDQ4419305.1 fumarylacetoacetate hydrolase family protein [Sphingobium sp. DEHP117]